MELPAKIGVVGVNASVMETDDLLATRSADAIDKDNDCTCPQIAGNINLFCICNGSPIASNVEMLTLACAADAFEFVSLVMEHTMGRRGAAACTAADRFSMSSPSGRVMLAVTSAREAMLKQVALASAAAKRRPVIDTILKGTAGNNEVTINEIFIVTSCAPAM